MNWYLTVLRNYGRFSGRARRKEYWMFALFNFIFIIVFMLLDNAAGTTIGRLPYGVFYLLYAIFIFIPGLAVAVRRLHDVGKSGWLILIALIPVIGFIYLFVLTVTEGSHGENEYGLNPKEIQEERVEENNYGGDSLILAVVIWMVFSRFFWTIIPRLVHDFYREEWFKISSALMGLIGFAVPFVLAITMKNKNNQMTAFILGGLSAAYGIYEMIMQFMHPLF